MDTQTPETPNPETQAVEQNQIVQPVTAVTTDNTDKQALWSMILGITSVVLAIIIFISIPAAIAAIALGIIGLVKHSPGKGKNLTGVITGGIALLVVIPLFIILAQVLGGADSSTSEKTATPTTNGTSASAMQVKTDCYTYAIPTGYVYEEASLDCHTAVNYPDGDALTRIQVKGTTGTVGTLEDVVALYNNNLKNIDANSEGVVDKEQFTVNGKTVYYLSYKNTYGLLSGVYIINDPESIQQVDGEPIVAYSVLGYTYNSALKGVVRGIVDGLETK